MKSLIKIQVIPFLLAFILLSCGGGEDTRKIFFINFYHVGYPSRDGVTDGIMEALSGKEIDLEIFYMDSKQNPAEDQIKGKVKEAMKRIMQFSPEVIIASDDNAVKYLVAPYLDTAGIPVVFCGVNWSADQYGLGDNITGMLEVSPLRECISTIKRQYPDIDQMTVLSENTTSEKNNTELLDTLYRNLGFQVDYRLVDDFEQWKSAFEEISRITHLIFLPTNGAIRGWDREEAKQFVAENIRVPIITCDDFMMDYAVFGLTKVFREQGEWAAATALRIMDRTLPASIPVTRNTQFRAFLNRNLANRMGFELVEMPQWELTEIK